MIDLQNKPKEFCDLYALANPIPGASAKVPILEAGPVVMTESLVVNDYVADAFPDSGLVPSSSADRACMRLFSELCGSSTFSYWGILRAKDDEEKFAAEVEKFTKNLINANVFLEAKSAGGPFLFGEQFTLAECNTAPFLQRACKVLPAFVNIDPLEICDENGLTRLKTWILAILARPSVKSIELSEEDTKEGVKKMLERFAAMVN